MGSYDEDLLPYCTDVVYISDRHKQYFDEKYHVRPEVKQHVIDLGVRIWDYEQDIVKVPHRLIWCSVPGRGLHEMRPIWDGILARVPDASLVITSDYRLWGSVSPDNMSHRVEWAKAKNVSFLGMVPRADVVKYQLEAELMVYPCTYDELFCIAAAECQVAGAVPITSDAGALATTNRFGTIIPGNPADPVVQKQSIDTAAMFFSDTAKDVLASATEICRGSGKRLWDWNNIAVQWELEVLQ
jgi:glycosyltransferase involved in cell wall biosynthesis